MKRRYVNWHALFALVTLVASGFAVGAFCALLFALLKGQ